MSAWAYYNEIDPFAAERLRTHIAAGRIMPGLVDERSIEDVTPDDLRGFTQVHLFAGIGVWSYALRRADWEDSRPVWTGSCPCQPFSAAGKGKGFADERHLWPAMHWLVGQRRPVVVFGEQSASSDGSHWIDLVQADVEALGYAFGACAFPAAGVGAPHIRDRAYWVAHSDGECWERGRNQWPARWNESANSCNAGGMAHTDKQRSQGRLSRGANPKREIINRSLGCSGADSGTGPVNGFWRDADWLLCRDGKWRPAKPGLAPLVNGTPSRVGRIRTYGNAINVEAAIVFIKSYMSRAGL